MNRIALVITIMLLLLFQVQAADIETSDTCSLADAITAANTDEAAGECPAGDGTDIISLSDDITLTSALPQITTEITIEGSGFTISGNNRYRIFYNDGGALTIHNLTIIEGRAEYGGAIDNWKGTLSISNSNFSNNSADKGGGAITNWREGELTISNSSFSHNSAEDAGAIANGGELSINDSAFSGNSADFWGGAIFNWRRTLTIISSSFSDNSAAERGGAIANGDDGELSISNSAFSYNKAERLGGAIFNDGELSIVNSAFSHNKAAFAGAIDNGGELNIVNSTFSGNKAGFGGAIANAAVGDLSMVNSIIAGGSRNACSSNGELTQNINNFIQDGTCSPAFSGDPMLGELVEPEDGSPAYYPLLEGSPAIGAADDEYCPDTDMLGTARPQGAACDIGAYERPQ